jgi:hypothetical protein
VQYTLIMNTSKDVRRPLKLPYNSTRTLHSEIAGDESDRVQRDYVNRHKVLMLNRQYEVTYM